MSSGLRDIFFISVVLIVLTSIPYLYGYISAPGDRWFSGILYNVHDTAQYFSWMRESGSRILIENKLTSETNPPIFINLHWWIPGRFAALTGSSLILTYHIFRIFAILIYVISAYWVGGLLFSDQLRRRFSFVLATFTSGLGWIWVLDKYLNRLPDLRFPHDIYTTPGNSFWVTLASPHLTFALGLTLLVLGLAYMGYRRENLGVSILGGLVALFLGLGHIYDLVTIWSVLAMFGMLLTLRDGFHWRTLISLGIVVLISIPAPLYFGWVSSSANPLWKAALEQYDNLGAFTPSPFHLTILLGLTLFLALGAVALKIVPIISQRNWRLQGIPDRELFLVGWFLMNLVIIYLPLKFQIMLLTGIQFILAYLATDFLFDFIIPRIQQRFGDAALTTRRLSWLLPVAVFSAVLPANLYLGAWRVVDLNRHQYPFYLFQDDRKAFSWLSEHASPDEVVLSGFQTGHYIPGFTGTRAFLANAVMTIDYVKKQSEVTAFYQGNWSDEESCSFLATNYIDYVYQSPLERGIGDLNPAEVEYLHPVFESDQVNIYRFDPGLCPKN